MAEFDANLKKFFTEQKKKYSRPAKLKVGILKGSTAISKKGKASNLNIPTYAWIQCVGSPINRIPPRDFFKKTEALNKDKWGKSFNKLVENKNRSVKNSMKLVGEVARADMKSVIASWTVPPNAPSTIKAKGKNTPLRDTGAMYNAIDYEVE